MAAHVLRQAERLANKTALSILGETGTEDWSFADLESAILGTGTGLLQAGLNPGDIVLMRLGNSVEFPIAYLGAIAVGVIPVPTSAQLTEPETAQMISDLSPAAVLRDPSIACAPHPKQVELDQLTRMRDLPPAAFAMGDPNRLAYVVYTSGTSGNPRAVAHAHRAIWARQMMVDGWYGLRENDRLCHAGAFNWTYTLGTGLMDPWTIGATALIPHPDTELANLPALLAEPLLSRLSPDARPFTRGLVSCTGNDYCNLALIETKSASQRVAQALDTCYPDAAPLRMYWSGCPAGCGNHHAADIGFQGGKTRFEGEVVDAVTIFAGGSTGPNARPARKLAEQVPVSALGAVLPGLIGKFRANGLEANEDLIDPGIPGIDFEA